MAKKFFFSFLAAIIFALPFYLLAPPKKIEKILPISYSSPPGSLVVARVGIYTLSEVSGWTSPYAEVTLTGKALARKTIANQQGFFMFINVPVRENLGELCLIAEDVNHIASFPTCIPPPQPKDELVIRNILLPPSISLEKGKIALGKTAKSSGMTFPESEVDVRLFGIKSSVLADFSLRFFPRGLKPAKTISPPPYKIKSNPNGYFEFSLPTANPSENRLYAISSLGNLVIPSEVEGSLSPEGKKGIPPLPRRTSGSVGMTKFSSPKSNTLTFLVYKSNWLLLLLLFLLLLLLLVSVFILKKEKKNKLLVLENEIAIYKPYCETRIPYGPRVLRF